MPKKVDHAARREEIVQAALRLCARDGLAGVTIGQVAQEAGVSKGLVQHYFDGKADLLRASAQILREEIERHVREAVRDARGPADTLRRVLFAIVELGVTAVVPLLAGHAFLSMAVADPEIRALYRAGGDAVHREIAALLAASGAAPDGDPGAEAHALLGLARGLADGVLLGELGVDDAAAIIDHHLRRILPGVADGSDTPSSPRVSE
ncbi:TetR/AcrR family transcriptional regulator [Microbispora bryophytorum]|uniref:TetR family transcriptional regulator n=1 Tax=Microbispora bryophytorum subsp. camponoti TaxID=1677852 RepID=A0ABR8L8Z2_9ACTN|nr:TetR family transcriptional regulator [Microbispora camponoti]MBD3146132.1 TetR family transcriptional regulator [Microbispora camponoti]